MLVEDGFEWNTLDIEVLHIMLADTGEGLCVELKHLLVIKDLHELFDLQDGRILSCRGVIAFNAVASSLNPHNLFVDFLRLVTIFHRF